MTALVAALRARGVALDGVLLKIAMVLPGNGCGSSSNDEEVARVTMDTLQKSVPKDIGGIVYLSGGQGDDDAFRRLRAIASLNTRAKEEKNGGAGTGGVVWPMSFSFGRALQRAALKAWAGKADTETIRSAQRTLVEKCKLAAASTTLPLATSS